MAKANCAGNGPHARIVRAVFFCRLRTAASPLHPYRRIAAVYCPLGNLCNCCTAATRHVLNEGPRTTFVEQTGDARIALFILWAALVLAVIPCLGLTLSLTTSPVIVLLASYR